jgi:hypothetical protein
MAYTENHCDLNKIKDKPIYGFTIRQMLSFLLILAIGIPTYAIMFSKGVDTTIACLIICFIAFPIFFAGTYEDINGRTVEKILYAKIRLLFLTKNKRPFATNNAFEAVKMQRQLEQKYRKMVRKEQLRKQKKKKRNIKIFSKQGKKETEVKAAV